MHTASDASSSSAIAPPADAQDEPADRVGRAPAVVEQVGPRGVARHGGVLAKRADEVLEQRRRQRALAHRRAERREDGRRRSPPSCGSRTVDVGGRAAMDRGVEPRQPLVEPRVPQVERRVAFVGDVVGQPAQRRTPRRREAACGGAADARRPGSSRSACAPAARRPRRRRRASLPLPVRHTGARVGQTRQDEQQIGEPVDVGEQLGVHGLGAQRDDVALGATADRARQMQGRAGRRRPPAARTGAAAGSSASASSIQASRRAVSAGPSTTLVTRAAIFEAGSASCAPRANRSRCRWSSQASSAESTPAALACPSTALSSSTWPYASTRGSALLTREPSNSAVSPASPVRV